LDYVRRFVPIFDIATQLDLRIVGSVAHCWRPDNHQHGDRTPSVGLFKRRNRAKCFVCDPKPLSPIDLVMSVLRLDFREALRWLTSRWEIPKAAKGKHIEHQQRWPERFRVVNGSTLGSLIRSGIWASFTPAQCKILPVLEEFADAQTRKVTISYRGIMRYSEVRSPSTVAAALRRFRSLRILSVETSRNDDGFRSCNSYRLTLDDPAFLTLANETYKKQKEAIAQERGLRAEARRQRQRTITGNSLSNGCSAGAFDATATRNVK
jgi:hypothetical protein